MNAQQQVTIKITAEDVNKVLAGLNQLPHGQVADLFQSIRIQVVSQMAVPAPQEPTPPQESAPAETQPQEPAAQ